MQQQDTDPTPAAATRTRLWPALLAVALMLGVLAAVGFMVIRTLDEQNDDTAAPVVEQESPSVVRLEPVTYRNPDPFTESVTTADPQELRSLVADNGSSSTGGTVRGDTALLYGARPRRPVCDVARLARLVTSDEQVTSSWAAAAGIAPEAVEPTVMGLSPVVLTADTAVTNHAYRSGTPSAYQSVLQAGTPVLIDSMGTPRAQCSCGNPLLPPKVDDSAEYDGGEWDGFDPDRVIEVEPSEGPSERIPAVDIDSNEPIDVTAGGSVELDGLLAVTATDVAVVDPSGATTTVIDQPVEAVFDDGAGGLVYTLARPDKDPDGYEDGPPTDPAKTVIWHLPSGASEATELVGVESAGGWNRLLGVGQVGDSSYVVFAPLVVEQIYEETSTPTGPVVAMDLATGERTVLVEEGFGWELGVGSVSFGGNQLALEYGYEIPDWLLFGAGLERLPNACGLGDGSDEARYDFVDANCPWQGALDDDGHLVFFGSALSDEAVVGTAETVETLDLASGTFLDSLTADFLADTQETRSAVSQVRGDRIATEFTLEFGETSAELIDRTNGQFIALPGDLQDSTTAIHLLTAPLVRPVAVVGGSQANPDSPPERPSIDPMNMRLPEGTCPTSADQPSPAVDLVDGSAQTGDDYTADDFLSFELSDEAVAWVDLDGDGSEELVVSVVCNWGGSGWMNSIVALRTAADGGTELAAPPLQEYERSIRSADALTSDEAGVLVVTGGEWTDADALCCPSSTFTARWTLRDGEWVQL